MGIPLGQKQSQGAEGCCPSGLPGGNNLPKQDNTHQTIQN